MPVFDLAAPSPAVRHGRPSEQIEMTRTRLGMTRTRLGEHVT